MTKTILSAFAVLFALSAPVYAADMIYQEEPASEQPAQPQPEGEGGGGGGD